MSMIVGSDVLVACPRNRHGWPLVLGQHVPRASKRAKELDAAGGLPNWYAARTAEGMGRSPDLVARAAVTEPDDRTAWREIADAAMERAASSSGRTTGTALHSTADLVDLGKPTRALPDVLRNGAEAYREATVDLEPLAGEVFVYSERYGVAGTLDRMYLRDGVPIVGDMKTGGNPDAHKYAGLSWATQIGIYATGRPYCHTRGLLEWADLGLPEPSQETGVVVHLVQGTSAARLWTVDVRAGLVAADLASRVVKARAYPFLT